MRFVTNSQLTADSVYFGGILQLEKKHEMDSSADLFAEAR